MLTVGLIAQKPRRKHLPSLSVVWLLLELAGNLFNKRIIVVERKGLLW